MAIRDFVDSAGTSWRVWDVRPDMPDLLERRHVERRRTIRAITFDDRRSKPDRRANTPTALSEGWLVFRSDGQRRRLFGGAPALDDASEAQLEEWLAAA